MLSTMPISIVRQFRFKVGDRLQWKSVLVKGKMTVIVQPIDGGKRKRDGDEK